MTGTRSPDRGGTAGRPPAAPRDGYRTATRAGRPRPGDARSGPDSRDRGRGEPDEPGERDEPEPRPPRRRGRTGVRVVSVLLALALVGGWLWVVYGSGLLTATRVSVEGTHRLSAAQVRKAAAVPLGTPLARVDLDAIRAGVGRLPQVAAVGVRREWPHTVAVTVVERVPVATVRRGTAWYLVDVHAVVVGTQPARPRLPVLDVARPEPGDPATASALAAAGSLPRGLRRDVRAVSADTPDSVRLRLVPRDGRHPVVIWGDAGQAGEKSRVLAALRRAHPTARVYDVSSPGIAAVRP